MLSGYDVYIRKVVENGQPVFPEAFCLTETERLNAKEKGIHLESIERLKATNRAKFYGQYLNDPLDEETLEFKRDWFQRYLPTPELSQRFAGVPALISVDPAFRLKQYNDFTGLVVTKTLPDNNVYVLEAKAIKVSPKGLVDEIFNTVATYGNVYKVLVETVTSQVILMDLLNDEMRKRNTFFVIEEVKPDTNETKAVRIRGLIPHYANRRVFHSPNAWILEDQLVEFPKGAHDDVIDALAYQVKYWKAPHEISAVQPVKEGTYTWWQQRTRKRPSVMGKLFSDFRGH